MGSVYSREVLKVKSPRVGLMNIGSEPNKGNELTKAAYKLLEAAPIHFIGNVEGHDLFGEGVDVVVCDGFVGNVMLKSAERLAKAISGWLRSEIQKNPMSFAGGVLARISVQIGQAPHQRGGIRWPAFAGRQRHLHQGAWQFFGQGDQECDPGGEGSRDSEG